MPFKPGQSGNPGGRRKRTKEEFDLIAACRSAAPEALSVMRQIMEHGDNDRVRLSAAIAIVERGFGPAAAAQAQTDGKDEALRELADRLPG